MSLDLAGAHSDAVCAQLAKALLLRDWKLATAESCTGGLIAAACTAQSGSSAWFERGMVTYSNEAKCDMLDVPLQLISEHGAVSEPVVRAMVAGALARSRAQVSVAVTGVAGPLGGSPAKPVGTVWFGWCVAGQVSSAVRHFPGGREAVRTATVRHALSHLLLLLPGQPLQAPRAAE